MLGVSAVIQTTYEAANAEVANLIAFQFLREYDPRGYDSSATVIPPDYPGGVWRVVCRRFQSCD